MGLFGFIKSGSRHEKAVEKYRPTVDKINGLESEVSALSDDGLKARAQEFYGKDLEDLKNDVAEIYALVREAAKRSLKMRHFDVQMLGGLSLLDGTIAEMKTGEGKTLVATLPLTLHALTGKGAHLVTVNDYLSQRDADWMRPVYEFLGLSVGVTVAGMNPEQKKEAYAADITYGTNNEFGFDYLRDNMATSAERMVMRELHFAIIDEVDSILIDEARTPLIISAPDVESTKLYQKFSSLVPSLQENTHFNIDEKRRAATLTEEGIAEVEKQLNIENLYADGGVRNVHHLEQALRAQTLYKKDKDYVVKDGNVVIVDEFTGRLMDGRRYSEGLHQAIEAKEGVKVQQESKTLATITFQNFFRLYDSLAGMTGTAVTSAEEFEKVYNLDVAVVPTNKPLAREDKPDRIYATEDAKFNACMEEIKARNEKGQPVLVGTAAIEKSEKLSDLLKKNGVKHEVLNAKHHDREAEIIADAGQKGAVTISTNMAGRGTDIKLGDDVGALGGLFVLGTERHEARRIDNQLRGRSGRQGDPGETQFFVSTEDDVMRVFGGDRMRGIMKTLKIPENEAIEHKMLHRILESAQEKVEGHYFDMRKQVLSYDDVLNKQRNAIYTLRRNILLNQKWQEAKKEPEELADAFEGLLGEQAAGLVQIHTREGQPDEWDVKEVAESIASQTGDGVSGLQDKLEGVRDEGAKDGPEVAREKIEGVAHEVLKKAFVSKQGDLGEDATKQLIGAASLRAIDVHWMEHLDTMEYLRTGIGLRGYGQRDPLVEYQKEGFRLFQELLVTIKGVIVEMVFKAQPTIAQTESALSQLQQSAQASHEGVSLPETAPGAGQAPEENKQLENPHKNISRNDPCYCGSGKKYKKCHGA